MLKVGRTVRPLRGGQVFWRIFYCLPWRPRVRGGQIPYRRTLVHSWSTGLNRLASSDEPCCFRFLNVEGKVGSLECWNDIGKEKLCLYSLHYFDDLCAINSAARTQRHVALIRRWIAENPIGGGNGWEPYPTSLRVVNWIKWLENDYACPEGTFRRRQRMLRPTERSVQPSIKWRDSV